MKSLFHKNSLKNYAICSFFFVSILGTLSHFFYEWSNENPIIGLFCPINESTWEHMKLTFFPMLLSFVWTQKKFGSNYPYVSFAYPVSILLGTCLIPVLFYSYSGILGANYMILDILTFYVSVFLAFVCFYHLSKKAMFSSRKQSPQKENARKTESWMKLKRWTYFLLFLFFLFFLMFTYCPPKIGIFQIPNL